ncbi:hypothetical protein HOK31_20910, partial [Candidatus Poribacteria bacterium]|nr:hypothetical protein [Candidatus Poribacteria bacterium]
MRHIEAVAEDEMIAAYVRAESASHRHSGELRDAMRRMGVGADVVECPDISDADQNAARRAPLTETREYGTRRGLFDAHKLIVATMLVLRVMQRKNEAAADEVDYLVMG